MIKTTFTVVVIALSMSFCNAQRKPLGITDTVKHSFKPFPEQPGWVMKGDTTGPRIAKTLESQASFDKRMKWWRNAKFGMFIHWTYFSAMEGYYNGNRIQNSSGSNTSDWIFRHGRMTIADYTKVIENFDPQHFDANEWVKQAKSAGMKYIVITTKHHDGFALWPTKAGGFNITQTRWWKREHRDPLKELAAACKKQGVVFGVYYSILDWTNPKYEPHLPWLEEEIGQKGNHAEYVRFMKAQLKELADNYHPQLFWFDGQWDATWTSEKGMDVYNYLRKVAPNAIINNRLGKNVSMTALQVGDYVSAEQYVPKEVPKGNWETCMTMNGTWGFDRDDHKWKNADRIYKTYESVISNNGNFLLNIGPDHDGVTPEESIQILKEVGVKIKDGKKP